jgi:hypothetical protein
MWLYSDLTIFIRKIQHPLVETLQQFNMFTSSYIDRLFCKCWNPAPGLTLRVVVVIRGSNSHALQLPISCVRGHSLGLKYAMHLESALSQLAACDARARWA